MDLRRSDLGLLVSLDALLAEESVTAASKRLGLSQPALSAQLARLRDLFGDDLLVGNAHGMTPTPRAEALREPLHLLLEDLKVLVSSGAAFDPATADRVFRIGATDLVHALLTPPLLKAIAETAPGVRLAAMPLRAEAIGEAMTRGDVDMSVTTAETAPDGFPALKLMDEDFRVIWREDHPDIAQEMTIEAFCAHPHLLVSPTGGGFRGVTDEALKARGLTRRVIGSLPSFLLAPEAVRCSDCLAVVPTRLAALDARGLRSAPVPVATPGFTLFLSWHPRMKNDAGHRWMRELVRARCR